MHVPGVHMLAHKVLEVLPSGYQQTAGNTGYAVTGDASGLDFANFNLVDLSGKKYLDKTGDGISADDGRLGNVRIFVDLNDNGSFDAVTETAVSTTTAADGTWSMTDLLSLLYALPIFEVLPSGYQQTAGNTGYAVTGDASGLD